jgi:uncharacterized radical SAM superfamily Fe-S cluster-containing enzyme
MTQLSQVVILDSTESVCPVCFKKISASIIEKNSKVFIQKVCPSHGSFKSLYWDDLGAGKQKFKTVALLTVDYAHLTNNTHA